MKVRDHSTSCDEKKNSSDALLFPGNDRDEGKNETGDEVHEKPDIPLRLT